MVCWPVDITMKTIYTLLLLAASQQVQAQFVTCESMPLNYDQANIQFTTSVSTADSMMVIPITNTSSTNFAYPEAKIIPLSPLPTGTTMFDHNWHVFFSSWNTGVTGYVNFFFNVSTPIPTDYTCQFKLMVTNFPPLATDSCYFTDTVTVNLNPTTTSVKENKRKENIVFGIYPNPATEWTRVITNVERPTVVLYDIKGTVMNTFTNPTWIDLRTLNKGIYFMRCLETEQVQKLVKN